MTKLFLGTPACTKYVAKRWIKNSKSKSYHFHEKMDLAILNQGFLVTNEEYSILGIFEDYMAISYHHTLSTCAHWLLLSVFFRR